MKKYPNFLLEKKDFVKNLSLEDAIAFFKFSTLYETIIEKGIIPPKENLFFRIITNRYTSENGEYRLNGYDDYNLIEPDSIVI